MCTHRPLNGQGSIRVNFVISFWKSKRICLCVCATLSLAQSCRYISLIALSVDRKMALDWVLCVNLVSAWTSSNASERTFFGSFLKKKINKCTGLFLWRRTLYGWLNLRSSCRTLSAPTPLTHRPLHRFGHFYHKTWRYALHATTKNAGGRMPSYTRQECFISN